MKMIDVMYYSGTAQTFIYMDGEEAIADANYAILKKAIDAYHKFKNDTGESVTISGPSGESTFRIEHLTGVFLSDAGHSEQANIQFHAWRKRIKDAVNGPSSPPQP